MSSLHTGSVHHPAKHFLPGRILGVICALFIISAPAFATGVVDARWDEQDLLIRFADSVSYTVDLAESDSSQLVLRVMQAQLPRNAATSGIALPGPRLREAIITQSGPDEIRITVRAAEGRQSGNNRQRDRGAAAVSGNRLGYASLWRPYSHTLVVHTFDWNNLDYGQEQYYKALLALEQGLEPYGLELLRIAYATGDSRAASVLGAWHARRGEHNLATQYLAKPITADDFAALAAGQSALGDTVSALRSRQTADRMNAEGDSSWARSTPESRSRNGSAPTSNPPGRWSPMDARNRWLYLGGGILLLILLIFLVIRLSRRSPSRQATGARPEPPIAPPPYSTQRTEPVERTVVARDIPAPPPVHEPYREPVQERIPEPAPQPISEMPPVRDTTPVETVEEQPEQRVTPREEIIDVEARPVTPEPVHELSAQVAELRRRIESMHQAQEAQQPKATPASESTLDEARRLQLSRDSVELRRRLKQETEQG